MAPTTPPALTKEEIAELPDPQDPLAPELESGARRELSEAQNHLLEQLKEWRKLRADSTLTAEELARVSAHVQQVDAEGKNLDAKIQQDGQATRSAFLSLEEIRQRGKRVVEEIETLRKASSKNRRCAIAHR